MKPSEIEKIIENLANFARRLWKTYKWTAPLSPARLADIKNEKRLGWWSYCLTALVITVVVTIGGNIAAFRLNVLSMYSPPANDIAGVVSDINDTGHQVWSELETLSLGDAGLIALTTLSACFVGIRLIARVLHNPKKGRPHELQLTFLLSSALIKFSISWLIASLIATLFRYKFEVAFRAHDQSLYTIFLFSVIFITLLGSHLERAWLFKLRKTDIRIALAGVMWATTVVAIEMTAASAIATDHEPSLVITVSQKCDQDACIVFVRPKHIKNHIIASKIRLQVNLLNLNDNKKVTGWADIELSPTPFGPGALAISSAAEQIAFVRSVSFICPFDPKSMNSYIFSEATGNNLLHVFQSHYTNAVVMANFSVEGRRAPLFRLARATCVER